MKRFSALLLALVMTVSLTACGGGQKPAEAPAQQTAAPSGTDSQKENLVENLFRPATSSATGAYATITVSAEVKLDDESAWLGLCPAGKDYITEEEADDVDVIWFSYDAREEGDPYVYSCDFSSVEDGTYALVVTSSDDASIGYVVIQLLMTKDGDQLTFDYTNAKYNERPSAVQAPSSENTGSTEFPKGDPVEYSREYWEEKYPGENVCPFYIEENGVEYNYYWVSGLAGWNGKMESWIDQPFNWNGWHRTDDGCIVNKDETLKLTDDWANGDEGMSSFCTVTTEPYDPESAGNGELEHNVPKALSFRTQEDLACQENVVFSAVYVGTEEDKSEDNDGVFFDFCNEDALYYVHTGFDADGGAINHIWGYVRLYHFYNDEASYQSALENVPAYALKEQNDECLYFTTGNVRDTYAESYAELMDMFANQTTDGGEFDNFMPFEG